MSTRHRTVALALALVFAACASCAHDRHDVRRIPASLTSAGVEVGAHAVPAGTELTIALVDDIGTRWSVEGQVFRATLVTDLAAVNGEVLVRAGTLLHGVITRVRSGADPMIAIDIPAIETADGPAPFEAKLKDAPDNAIGSDAVLTAARTGGAAAYADDQGHYDARTNEIHVPAGGRMRLQLTRGLVAVGYPRH